MRRTARPNGAVIFVPTIRSSTDCELFFQLGPPSLSPSALTEVCSGLILDLDRSFFLNLGNDRPNITPSNIRMNGSKHYAAIDPYVPNPADVHSVDDLPKTITFTNAVKKTQVICRHLRRLYPNVRGAIDFLHARRSVKAKRRVRLSRDTAWHKGLRKLKHGPHEPPSDSRDQKLQLLFPPMQRRCRAHPALRASIVHMPERAELGASLFRLYMVQALTAPLAAAVSTRRRRLGRDPRLRQQSPASSWSSVLLSTPPSPFSASAYTCSYAS
ncbi:hypothetical protein C8R44DRAFT_892577 [Mycena epipterygia]|nr:hypothetical protein C8R44DRAFT_892577 [Mycena epipterygia]